MLSNIFSKNCFEGYLSPGCAFCEYWKNGNGEIGCSCPFPISDCKYFDKEFDFQKIPGYMFYFKTINDKIYLLGFYDDNTPILQYNPYSNDVNLEFVSEKDLIKFFNINREWFIDAAKHMFDGMDMTDIVQFIGMVKYTDNPATARAQDHKVVYMF